MYLIFQTVGLMSAGTAFVSMTVTMEDMYATAHSPSLEIHVKVKCVINNLKTDTDCSSRMRYSYSLIQAVGLFCYKPVKICPFSVISVSYHLCNFTLMR